ncbi:Ger(x)C family spore germination protein [Gracilibacillus salitolerans]|uniref:Ger(X)C family spore germination protein n=1 Tax=Gracilibacillus salitolerans TaxID=2663022 RepID=A0A5Q2TK05_9BACI|nr:Ger(x)C family spore germination protein [Gracilibacillus salitolerans]QGH34210.1 Ger(x)C family spore germination protein [Gracilibacillus salitolerans]
MVKLSLKLIFLVFVIVTLTGCWDTKDIDHRLLPVAMGISKEGEEYQVILQVPEPVGGQMKNRIIKESGQTITKTIDTLSGNMESQIDLLHVKVILIDKQLAKEGVKDVISGFMRSRDVSSNALVTICDEDIEKFFNTVSNDLDVNAINLFEFFEKNAGWTPQIALTRVWQVYRSVHSYTHDVAVPIVVSGGSTNIRHMGSAVMKNGKMVETITPDETLLINAFKEESAQGRVEVSDHASVLIISNKTNSKSNFIDDEPSLENVINLKVVLLETKSDHTIELIKEELSTILQERFDGMFTKLQESEADILGLGQHFRNKIPRRELKDWRSKYYQELKMHLSVEIDIQNTGFLKSNSSDQSAN